MDAKMLLHGLHEMFMADGRVAQCVCALDTQTEQLASVTGAMVDAVNQRDFERLNQLRYDYRGILNNGLRETDDDLWGLMQEYATARHHIRKVARVDLEHVEEEG